MKKLIPLTIFLLLLIGNVFALNIDEVETSPSTVEPGNRATIKMQIENNFDYDLTDVLVKLDLSSGSIPISPAGSSTELIDELDENDKEDVEFDVIVLPDAKPGIYKIPVLITYQDDENDTKEKEDVISLIVDTQTKIIVSLDEPNFIVGDRSTISIKVVNQGLADAQFLNLKLGNSAFYELISPQEIYIGELDSDDYDTVEFDIRINHPIPGELPIKVYLEYKDALNNPHSDTNTVDIKVYTQKEAEALGLVQMNNTPWTIAGIVILIIVFFVYRKIKKRKKRRQK